MDQLTYYIYNYLIKLNVKLNYSIRFVSFGIYLSSFLDKLEGGTGLIAPKKDMMHCTETKLINKPK